jgi:hypothetical protein
MRPMIRRLLAGAALLAVATPAALAATATHPRPARTAPPAAPVPAPRVPVLPRPCEPATKEPATAPVPQAILDAFAVLRRARTDADALPDQAVRALRNRGLEPFDPAAARLLRTTDDGGRAWVVPVRDATISSFPCIFAPKAAALVVPGRAVRGRVLPFRPARPRAPRPGLAVVALGGAPAGAGGALEDLVRGREPVLVQPCTGPSHSMVTISGLVPDGVATAFLTSPDGTAIRTDVHDNAYAFVVPPGDAFQERYVVWTGGDGTPHVQPAPLPPMPREARCAAPPTDMPQVSPGLQPPCALPAPPFAPVPRRPRPVLPKAPPSRPVVPRLGRPALLDAPCAVTMIR